jgi:multiple sugar transport system substrate-binding protein
MKRIFACLLAVIVFAACGNDGGTQNETGGSELRVIRLGNWWNSFSEHIFNEPNPAEVDDYEVAMMIWENAQRIRREYNVEFEHVTIGYAEMVPFLTAAATGGFSNVDIVHLSGGMILPAITGNLILPLDSVASADSDLFGEQIHNVTGVFYNDNYWTFSTHMYEASGIAVGVNMDLVRSLGLPDPVELYNSGQWNWTNFLDIMRRASNTAGNFGMAGNHGDFTLNLIAANDGILVDENFNFGVAHPNTIEALELVDTIFRERLWYYNPVAGAELGEWGRNFWSFQEGNSVFWPARTWSSEEAVTFDFHILPWPLGPANTSGSTWFQGWSDGLAIPAAVEDPAFVLKIFEELHSWPGPDGGWRHLEESVNWPMGVFRHEDDVWRMLRDVGETGKFDFGIMLRVGGVNFSDIFNDVTSDLFNQYATPTEAVEVHRGVKQAMLDTFMGR